jgi:N-acetyl-anhydromuramyl-L-alanine amidase AmpD
MMIYDKTAQTPKTLCYNERPYDWITHPGLTLHHTGSTSEKGDLDWLMGGAARYSLKVNGDLSGAASCHKVFHRNGDITIIVLEKFRAYHAGWSTFKGFDDCNDYMIGYEICNNGRGEPYTQAQYDSLAHSIAYDCTRFHIPDSWVTLHRIIRSNWNLKFPSRAAAPKTDPLGLNMDLLWAKVAQVRTNWPYGAIFPMWKAA